MYTEHDYEHKLSILKRTIMVSDMSRTIYNKKGKDASKPKKTIKDSEVTAEGLFGIFGV